MPDLTLDQARDAVAKAMGWTQQGPPDWRGEHWKPPGWPNCKEPVCDHPCPPTLDGAHEAIKAAGWSWQCNDMYWFAFPPCGGGVGVTIRRSDDHHLDLWRLAALCWAEKGMNEQPSGMNTTAIRDITLAQLVSDPDWAQVFADESAGNVDKTVRVAPPGAQVNDSEMTRADVVQIIAAVNGENDGPEWLGVFLLSDGRYLVAQGGCDYTGWDCHAGNSLTVCATLADVLRYGLSGQERVRLGLGEPPMDVGL